MINTAEKAKVVTLGEIMLRLSPRDFQRFTQANSFAVHYGGSEANVGVALSGFGIPSAHVTRFPQNDLGRRAVQMLSQYQVDTSSIIYGPERMGLYFLETGSGHRSSRIIYDRSGSAFAAIQPGMYDWDNIFKDVSWFHWTGITPAISAGAAACCLEAIEAAQKKNITISADINYRRNLWQYDKVARDIMPALIEKSHHLVAGITDIQNSLGISGSDFDEVCLTVSKTYPGVRSIATTTRRSISASHNVLSGKLWTTIGSFHSRAYDLYPMVDRIGAGDAFMAGLIYSWINDDEAQDIIEFAVASSVWKHTVEGDFTLASIAEIESLRQEINVGQLLR